MFAVEMYNCAIYIYIYVNIHSSAVHIAFVLIHLDISLPDVITMYDRKAPT